MKTLITVVLTLFALMLLIGYLGGIDDRKRDAEFEARWQASMDKYMTEQDKQAVRLFDAQNPKHDINRSADTLMYLDCRNRGGTDCQ